MYIDYSDYILENLHKVTIGLYILNLHTNESIDILALIKDNLEKARSIFWYNVITADKLSVYIFKNKTNILGFAIMESNHNFLRYLYVDESFRYKKYGSKILQYLYSLHGTYKVHIVEKEYLNGLNKFYKRNNFTYVETKLVDSTKILVYQIIE